ncbi:MAG: PD40 domain-containing protein [Candidatus Wallbacteria bacterium]|nr:PD40 domain-containing protein [Candidatus Wallbacteria bacterium]
MAQLGAQVAGTRRGFSLAELTIAVLMISILSITAFMSYLGETDNAKKVACQRDFRLLREALRLYNEDHFQTPYGLNDASALYGRYLSAVPKDPWAAEYVIDPFLGRILSRGPDGVLETDVKGSTETADLTRAADDLMDTYDNLGLIACVVSQTARVFSMDTGMQASDVRVGIDAFGMGPDRETGIVAASGGLELMRNYLGAPQTQSLGQAPGSLADLAVSPDNTRYAAVTTDRKSIWIGPLSTDKAQPQPFNLFTTSSSEQLSAPSWSKDQQEIAVGTDGGQIWRIVVGAGAQRTVLTSDAATDVVKNAPSWSADGKWIAYASKNAGSIKFVSPAGDARRPALDVSSFASGSLGPVAWSPGGQKIAFVSAESLWIVSPQRPKDWQLEVTKTAPSNLSGARCLVWR